MADLTPRQRLFVKEYLVDLNATQAAKRAGYSLKTADKQGFQLLEKARIQEAIQAEMKEREKRTEITADRVLQELARIGFSDIGDFVDYGPAGVTIKESSEVDTKALAEVSEKRSDKGSTVTFKLHDKVSALEKLGRHLGLFKDKVELTGKDGGPLQVEQKILPRDEVHRLAEEMGLLTKDKGGAP